MQENIKYVDNSDELSLAELIQKIKSWYSYLKTKWKQILLVGFIGGCIGFLYAWMQPINYKAKTKFIVEESKSNSSLGGIAAMAGQFGLDIGVSTSSNILSGDNILTYLKSESLIKETLLTTYDSSQKNTLADKYCDVYNLKRKWSKLIKPKTTSLFYNYKSSIQQDSLLKIIINRFLKIHFSVERPEKKESFIVVNVLLENQLLAKYFSERIVKLATNRYISLKTSRQLRNVEKLQRRVDSLEDILNYKTFVSYESQKSIIDINQLYKSELTNVDISSRKKMTAQTIFGELLKNLEIAKATLIQETPVIEVIDGPTLPLPLEKKSRLIYAFLVSMSFLFLFFIYKYIYLILYKH